MLSMSAATAGCLDTVAATTDSASTGDATTGTTATLTTTGEPPATATSTTDTGAPPTTGTSEAPTTGTPPGPQPIQRCQLLPAPDLRDAACEGAADCQIREAMRVECDGSAFYHHLAEAPGDDAALYVQTQAVPTFADQHEAFSLAAEGSGLADMWVTPGAIGGLAGTLMPRADGQIELWYQDGQHPPTIHYPPHAEIDGEGYSMPDGQRDDIQWFIGTKVRPDDVPMAWFTSTAPTDIHAIFDLPGMRVEQPLIVAEAWQLWLHDVAGTLKLSWSGFDDGLDGTYLYVRDLDADPLEIGAPLVRTGDFASGRPLTAVLSPFGGDHGVVLTDRDIGEAPRLVAGEPWTYDEILGGTSVACPPPSCEDGCGAAPPCVESRADAFGVGLQSAGDSVRAWHLECPYDVSLTWKDDDYFDILCLCDKCRCAAEAGTIVDKSCELVASTLAPDPDAADKLLRTEAWRRSLGFAATELIVDAVVGDETLWLLTRSTQPAPQIVVWAVDTE